MSKDKKGHVQHDVIKIAGEAGAKAALEVFEQERKKALEKRRDRRLRNTKLLLRNYRMLKAHCEGAVFRAAQLDSDSVDMLRMMEETFMDNEFYVESIKRSAERTHLIMSHVKEMLRVYEIYCNTSEKEEDRRRYNALYALYIADDRMTVAEIADKENIDARTVYRDVDAAVEKLSALLFGIDGLDVTK